MSPRLWVMDGARNCLALCLFRRHPDRPVEADRLAVEVSVLDDLHRERGVFVGATETLGIGNLLSEAVLRRLRQAREHGGLHNAGRDRCDPNAIAGELTRERQGHCMHATL